MLHRGSDFELTRNREKCDDFKAQHLLDTPLTWQQPPSRSSGSIDHGRNASANQNHYKLEAMLSPM
eukprot:jgi/Chlat1/7525/Chrsp62S07043